VVALTEATEIATRIQRKDVSVVSIGKRPGKDPAAYVRLYRLLRRLKPDVVHPRNIGTLDCQVIAFLAGVKTRIHSEHGWDAHDPEGKSRKYRLMRRVFARCVHQVVALSIELEEWLARDVGIPRSKIRRICNGVDTTRFRPISSRDASLAENMFTIGSVTRFSPIKDPLNLVEAFIRLRADGYDNVRLLMVGDGPLKQLAEERLARAGLAGDACLPGAALDVAPSLGRLDVFVLGSEREGISNTILEAMAVGLPVVATRTGGNCELVEDGVTGALVEPKSRSAIADALARYVKNPELARLHGQAGRERVDRCFSLKQMVRLYSDMYLELTSSQGGAR
jgi:sugar transferase (PEP-CTERM/EpsH1 system associated)